MVNVPSPAFKAHGQMVLRCFKIVWIVNSFFVVLGRWGDCLMCFYMFLLYFSDMVSYCWFCFWGLMVVWSDLFADTEQAAKSHRPRLRRASLDWETASSATLTKMNQRLMISNMRCWSVWKKNVETLNQGTSFQVSPCVSRCLRMFLNGRCVAAQRV